MTNDEAKNLKPGDVVHSDENALWEAYVIRTNTLRDGDVVVSVQTPPIGRPKQFFAAELQHGKRF